MPADRLSLEISFSNRFLLRTGLLKLALTNQFEENNSTSNILTSYKIQDNIHNIFYQLKLKGLKSLLI